MTVKQCTHTHTHADETNRAAIQLQHRERDQTAKARRDKKIICFFRVHCAVKKRKNTTDGSMYAQYGIVIAPFPFYKGVKRPSRLPKFKHELERTKQETG